MLKLFKYLSIIIVGIVILLFLIIILAPYVIDMNKYKNMAIEKLSTELGRKISVDDVSLTIFTGLGISLSNLKVEDNPSFGGEFASLESFDIKVKLIPLIFKKVEVEKIVFNTPQIIIKRDKTDNWNFDDLKNKFGKTPEGNAKNVHENPIHNSADTNNSLPATILVSNFGIKNGTVEFVDGKMNTTTKLEDINFSVKNIFSNTPFSIDLTATLPGNKKKNFNLEATLEPLKSKTDQFSFSLQHIKDIDIKISSLDTDQFKPYYLPFLPQVSNIGELNLDIKGNTDLSPFTFKGAGNITMDKLILKNSDNNLSPKIKFNLDGNESNIDIKNFDIDSNSLNLVLSGQISDYKANPKLNLLINSNSIITQDIVKLLEGFDVKLPKELSISEKMTLSEIKINGTMSDMAIKGDINLTETNIDYKDMFRKSKGQTLNLGLNVNSKSGKIDLSPFKLVLQDTELRIDGNFVYQPTVSMNLNVQANDFNFTNLLPSLLVISNSLPKDLTLGGKTNISAKLSGALDNLDIKGNINLTETDIDYKDVFRKSIGQILNLGLNVNSKSGKIDLSPFKLVLQDTELMVDGNLIYQPTVSMNLKVQANDFNFTNLLPNLLIISNSLPKDLTLGGKTNISAKLSGEFDNLDIKGNINLDKTDLKFGDKFYKSSNVPGNLEFDTNLKSNRIDLRSYQIKLQNMLLTGKFSITDLTKNTLSGDISTNRFNLFELHQIIPELKRLNTQGFVDGKINLSGSFENIGYNGSINLAGVTLNPPGIEKPLRDLNAKIQLNADSAQIKDFSGKIEKANFSGWVTINNFKTPDINFKLNFLELDIPELIKLFSSSESQNPPKITQLINDETTKLASNSNNAKDSSSIDSYSIFASSLYAQELNPPGALKPIKPQKVEAQKIESKKEEPKKLEDKRISDKNTTGSLRANGNISIGKGNYESFQFSNFSSNVKFVDNNLDLDNLVFNIYGGTYKGDMHLDLKKPDPEYRLRCKVADVKSNDILSSNTSLKNILYSLMFVDLDVQGAGFDWAKISKSLTGNGLLKFMDGELTSFNLVENASMIANILGFPKIAKKVTKFQELKGKLEIKNGIFHTPDLNMKSHDFDLQANGNFGIDTSLDYDCKILFSKEVSNQMISKTQFAKYLADSSGRILLPLSIKGTIFKPHFTMDKNYITDIIKRKAEEKVKEKIDEGVKNVLDKLLNK